jgi:hypothetical protein
MKTEEIIKILLILGILYLLSNYMISENFSSNSNDSTFSIALVSNNKIFRIVSFFDLTDEYKKVFLYMLQQDYHNDIKKETSFLASGNEIKLINTTSENISQLTPNNISKVPLIIIPNDKVYEYTKSILKIRPTNDGWTPDGEEKYLFWNHLNSTMFYCIYDLIVDKNEVKGKFKDNGTKINIDPIKIKNRYGNEEVINKFKITEKSASLNNKTLISYLLTKDVGSDVEWYKYTDENQITQLIE